MTMTPILIAGPTASGKSNLALELALRLNGAVINTDSMQVYEDLRIISARPSQVEELKVPHFLYGVMDGAERSSAGEWGRMAEEALEEAQADGLRPIFVGGTGLYFTALTEGLSPIPEIPPQIRASAAKTIDKGGIATLYADLEERDPETAAKVRPSDPQRIQRAWEVLEATGRGLTDWQREKTAPVLKEPAIKIVLEPLRQKLYARCERRFERMLGEGGLHEVSALLKRGLDPTLPVMKALGIPEMGAYLHGDGSYDQAIKRAKLMTRRYAKRQMTWMRNQMGDWPRLDPSSPTLVDEAMALIEAGPVSPSAIDASPS